MSLCSAGRFYHHFMTEFGLRQATLSRPHSGELPMMSNEGVCPNLLRSTAHTNINASMMKLFQKNGEGSRERGRWAGNHCVVTFRHLEKQMNRSNCSYTVITQGTKKLSVSLLNFDIS